MARFLHAVKIREWALDYSPSRLRGVAVRRWELLAPHFEKRLSRLLMEVWRAGVFTEQTDADRQPYDEDFRNAILHGTMIEELALVGSWTENLTEAVGVPVVVDRAPFEVPVDHIHLFDIRTSIIRHNFDAALSDSELADLRAAVNELRNTNAPADLFVSLTGVRPIMDRMIPILLRTTDGFGIHNEFVRHWIVFNVRSARSAVDRRDRQAAYQSLEKIATALFPSEWAGEGPNPAGLAVDYHFIREYADPILKRKYRNRGVKRMELRDKLPQFERSLIDRFDDCSPRQFALELLSARYALKQSYVANLVKRGNLYVDITLHWRKALLPSPPRQPSS